LNLRLFIYPENSTARITDKVRISAVAEQPTSESPAGNPFVIVAKDVVEDLAHLHFVDAEEGPSLKSPMVAEKLGEFSQLCPVESKSGNLEKILIVSILVLMTFLFWYLIFGITLILHGRDLDWDLLRDTFGFSDCTRHVGAAETSETLITWPSIFFPEGFIPCTSDLVSTVPSASGIARITSIVLGCAAQLAFLINASLARHVNKRFSHKGRTFATGNKDSDDVPFKTLKFNGVDCWAISDDKELLQMALQRMNRNWSER
jgi:hypothetical protein